MEHLGYAITAHRAQGATVDTAHAIVHSSAMTRETFYVAMTRGRHSNVAYVATDEAHLEPHQQASPDGAEVTARTVLYGVLQHEGAEKSAHETITAEQDAWSSIKHLGDQYETIAQQAQAEHVTILLTGAGLTSHQLDRVIDSDGFGSLIAELRRAEANGHQTDQLIRRVVAAGGLDDTADLAVVLRTRVGRLAGARAGGTHRRGRSRLIAGLIPEAVGPMPTDMAQALTELKELIEQRAVALADTALSDHAPWTRAVGAEPKTPTASATWRAAVATIAAYRDRYAITSPQPLGNTPDTQLQRLDRQRATAALRRAQNLMKTPAATQTPTTRRGPATTRDGVER